MLLGSIMTVMIVVRRHAFSRFDVGIREAMCGRCGARRRLESDENSDVDIQNGCTVPLDNVLVQWAIDQKCERSEETDE